MLAQKDASIGGLLSEVAALRAAARGPGGPRVGSDEAARHRAALEAELAHLKVQLMDRETLLDQAEAKIAELQVRARVIEGTASRTHDRMSEARRAAVVSEKERKAEEASAEAARVGTPPGLFASPTSSPGDRSMSLRCRRRPCV